MIINAQSDIITSAEEINFNFKKSKDNGHEGLVIKDLLSQYHPGKKRKVLDKTKGRIRHD